MACCSSEMKPDQPLLVKGENIFKDLKGVNPWLLHQDKAIKDNVVDVSAAHEVATNDWYRRKSIE
jgi:hypothetical protein